MSLSVLPTPPTPRGCIAATLSRLSPLARLSEKERKLAIAIAEDPTSLPKACRSAGYTSQATRYILRRASFIEGLEEAVALRNANLTQADAVISQALKLIENKDSSDMAKARCLELIADIKGMRKPSQAQEQADGRQASATYIPSTPALEAASGLIKQLNAGKPCPGS